MRCDMVKAGGIMIIGNLYREKETKIVYRVIETAVMHSTHESLVIYRNTGTGEQWAKTMKEFFDGSFEQLQ